jgi:hypothetical protein
MAKTGFIALITARCATDHCLACCRATIINWIDG